MFCIRDRKSHGPPRLSAFQTYGSEVSGKKTGYFYAEKFEGQRKEKI
jgi:hypothetical protein